MEHTALDTPHVDTDKVIDSNQQLQLFALRPPKQLLKWIGNKQRYASQIADLMPEYNTYIEPFLGSGALLCFTLITPCMIIINDEVMFNIYPFVFP